MRLLGEITCSPAQSLNPNIHIQQPQRTDSFDSDVVVILSALLCAVICVLGLFAAARCTWIRRFSGGHPISTPPPPPPSPPNSGLNKKVLESLPKVTFDPNIDEKLSDCAICLADFSGGDELRILPLCGHGFHVLCIDTWLDSHSSCPSCRRILGSAKCGCHVGLEDVVEPDTESEPEQQSRDHGNRSFP